MKRELVTVCGAGGFIGGHLVNALLERGNAVIAVDIKDMSDWHQQNPNSRGYPGMDLKDLQDCKDSVHESRRIFNLAADMGGMGFIEANKAKCMLSVLINTNLLNASVYVGAKRYFFASSACVYNATKQASHDLVGLKEEDAYPAMPEDGYGWEKLFSERMCRHFMEDFGLETRVARYHNVYGPHGTYEGGREKAPAAICRKIIEAKLSGKHEIEIWGDGMQTRSFMYIDDCIKGTLAIMDSDVREPLNLGSSELVSINQLVSIVEEIAGIKVKRNYKLDAPRGVAGRNSDNTKFREHFGWEPSISLRDGLEKTYAWIHDQMVDTDSGAGFPIL